MSILSHLFQQAKGVLILKNAEEAKDKKFIGEKMRQILEEEYDIRWD